MGSRRDPPGWTPTADARMLGRMFGIHPAFLIVVLALVLIVFGPGKLPEVGGAIGRGLREFRHASDSLIRPPEPAAPPPPAPVPPAEAQDERK